MIFKDHLWEAVYAAAFTRLFIDSIEVRKDHLVQDKIEECIGKANSIANYEQEMRLMIEAAKLNTK